MEPDCFIEIQPAKNLPEISFLMPVYQQARYVRAAIQSILAQRNIVAEILISDDASSDDTFDIAASTVWEWLAGNDCPHRIVLRSGKTRLWRDHIPLLAEAATCDVVCQAHGDDISHPMRGKILLSLFRDKPKAVLIASRSTRIDAEGVVVSNQFPVAPPLKISRLPFDVVIQGHPDVIGFSQAWRRQAVAVFPRLDRNRAAVAHDRILPFRSAIIGEVYLVEAQLVLRREHSLAAHHVMFDDPDTGGRFRLSLSGLTRLLAMEDDLAHALRQGLVTKEEKVRLSAKIHLLLMTYARKMVEAYREQTLAGRQIAWVDDEALLKRRVERLDPSE